MRASFDKHNNNVMFFSDISTLISLTTLYRFDVFLATVRRLQHYDITIIYNKRILRYICIIMIIFFLSRGCP